VMTMAMRATISYSSLIGLKMPTKRPLNTKTDTQMGFVEGIPILLAYPGRLLMPILFVHLLYTKDFSS